MALKPNQAPLFAPSSDWVPPRVGDLPSWAGAKRVGYDLETKDPDLRALGPGVRRPDCYVTGFSFAIEDGPSFYVPLRHEGGDNVEDPDQAWRYLREQAGAFEGLVVGAKLDYDLDWSAENKVEFSRAAGFRDIQIADPLINELHHSYSLDSVASRWGMPGKDDDLLKRAARYYGLDPKSDMWRLPARYVGPYGARDAALPLQILRRQEREIEEQDLWNVFLLESRLQPALVRMRRRGVRVDMERVEKIERWSLEQQAQALDRVRHITGVRVEVTDVMKAGAIAPALEHQGVKVPSNVHPKSGKVSPSIDKDFLSLVAANSEKGGSAYEVATSLARARKVDKIRTTFAASIRRHLVNGRIHCSYNQLRKTKDEGSGMEESRGAAYGRLSSENPNMQQQPSRDPELGPMWRSIYIPEEGAIWGMLDFSQQEPRMTVHYAEVSAESGFLKYSGDAAREAAQRYRDDPAVDNHDMMTRLVHGAVADTWDKAKFKKERGYCKELLLGRTYGMGGAKLCWKLKLPTRWAIFRRHEGTLYFEDRQEAVQAARDMGGRAWEVAGEEGQRIIDTFDSRMPFIKELADLASAEAGKRGFVRTLSGRRCRFPENNDGTFGFTYRALNRVIQGGSADQTKKSVIDGDLAGHFIQLQVHDEIDGSFGSVDEAVRMAECMRDAYKLNVPFKVDVECGPSWGEAKGTGRVVI